MNSQKRKYFPLMNSQNIPIFSSHVIVMGCLLWLFLWKCSMFHQHSSVFQGWIALASVNWTTPWKRSTCLKCMHTCATITICLTHKCVNSVNQIMLMGCVIIMYSMNICHKICTGVCSAWYFIVYTVLSGFVCFIYLYSSGLLHWHWGNHMIAPVPVKQPWKSWLPQCQWNNPEKSYDCPSAIVAMIAPVPVKQGLLRCQWSNPEESYDCPSAN